WSYKYVAPPELKAVVEQGYVGVTLPSLSVLWMLTMGTNRGLFYFQPLLVFGVAGLAATLKSRRESWLLFSIFILNILFYSGWANQGGGWMFGPRYLVPLVPFLMYGCALWCMDSKRSTSWYVFLALVGFSIPAMLMGSATYLLLPRFLDYILQWQVPSLFWSGFFGLNWGDLFGFSDAMIQALAILLVLVPIAVFLWKAQAGSRQWAAILIPLSLVLFGTGIFQRLIQAKMPAAHAIAIGRIGYIQGQYPKAMEYLLRGRSRTRNPALLGEAERWIALIQQKTQNPAGE
ncbi:MAG TPA: hypothetical protein VLR94_09340, partial [Acidobacteriota bacterium]|nr:hypothetical protein [Acidobacteriota bacterium]